MPVGVQINETEGLWNAAIEVCTLLEYRYIVVRDGRTKDLIFLFSSHLLVVIECLISCFVAMGKLTNPKSPEIDEP